MRTTVAIIALLTLLASFALILRRAHAQELDVSLARVCVAEAGWNVDETGECAAIYAVAVSRAEARRVPVLQALRDYARNHFDAGRSSRPWVAGLDASGNTPPQWPARLPWPRYRPRWLLIIAHAQKVIAGDVEIPCVGPVEHWGGAMDDARANRAGLVRVTCSGTLNHFWRRR